MEETGAITSNIDAAQITLYAFFVFFAGLIYYLRSEDKREGYPVEPTFATDPRGTSGFPPLPSPKTFNLPHAPGIYRAPAGNPERRELRLAPTARWPGAPYEPTGNAMLDGVGSASYVEREDEPELLFDGRPNIVPIRDTATISIHPRDPDPRGMEVLGGDGQVAGKVSDIWIDRSEPQIRFLEVEVAGGSGKHVLVPMPLAKINGWRRRVKVRSILAGQFADVPATKSLDQVTKLEEDKIYGYFAGGKLYASPGRLEPLL